jgi:CDP-glucose 4,6-dehydratase
VASRLEDFYRGKTVLITGHTGFKGSWLAVWLTHLGAKVVGYALEPPSDPCNFVASSLEKRITHIHADVCDNPTLEKAFKDHRPDVVLHLAAQSLVRRSFDEPRLTFDVNLMGTLNVLEAARRTESVRAVVAVTSDKCYRNVEWEWGYRETDELGGYDPYSASKACAEIAIRAYQDPRFQQSAQAPRELAIASARAGNVIGGGDWARDRIVPDIVRAIAAGTDIVLRRPDSTRPWQHVLEPLSGYLWLGALVEKDPSCRSAWNVGPSDGRPRTVEEIAGAILNRWSTPKTRLVIQREESGRESLLLRLDCSKAHHHLRWRTAWDIEPTLDAIVEWYQRFYERTSRDMYAFSVEQIERYTEAARRQNIAWAESGATGS